MADEKKTKPTGKEILNYEYPLNLILAIADCALEDLSFQVTADTHLAIEHVLTTLTPREERVLELRFKENWTRKQIGDEFCTSPSRAEQIEHKALVKLRHPGRFYIIRKGLFGWMQERIDSEYQRGLEDGKKIGYSKCLEDIEKGRNTDGIDVDVLELRLDEINLSIRAQNCLIAKGWRTVNDIVSLTTYDIEKIRNFGQKSMIEVANKINKLGIRRTAWDKYL